MRYFRGIHHGRCVDSGRLEGLVVAGGVCHCCQVRQVGLQTLVVDFLLLLAGPAVVLELCQDPQQVLVDFKDGINGRVRKGRH